MLGRMLAEPAAIAGALPADPGCVLGLDDDCMRMGQIRRGLMMKILVFALQPLFDEFLFRLGDTWIEQLHDQLARH